MDEFDRWNNKKKELNRKVKAGYPKEKEIWWCSIGLNVGAEIFGKGEGYARPVVVINADNKNTFIGIPLTSKLKEGRHFCIVRTPDGKLHTVLLLQIRCLDKRRFLKKICQMPDDEYIRVRECFFQLYKI